MNTTISLLNTITSLKTSLLKLSMNLKNASQHDLHECSRSGCYHNKLYAYIAKLHGLTCEFVKKYGWALTGLKEETRKLLNEFFLESPESFIYRTPVTYGQSVKQSSTRKYVCPICGQSIRATKDVRIMCLDCMKPMELEQ